MNSIRSASVPDRPIRAVVNDMRAFECHCGHLINLAPLSNHAGYMVWDCDIDASMAARKAEIQGFLAAIGTGQREAWLRYFFGSDTQPRGAALTDADVIEAIISQHDNYTRFCYRCSSCGRLYVQSTARNGELHSYRPEGDSGTNHT